MKTKYSILIVSLIFGAVFLSCSKMNDLHMDYLLEGERIYVGKPDSVQVLPGINRLEFRYWVSDPKVKKMKVYWNNDLDSQMVEIPNSSVNEPNVLEIKNLEPKNYTFKIVTYNKNWENPSIPMEVTAEVYSEKYLTRLFTRKIEYANYLSPEKVHISLLKPTEKSIASIITYTNINEDIIDTTISNDISFIVLDDFKEKLEITTSFLPFVGALDTLHSVPEEFTNIDILLDKSLFKRWNPVGIPYKDLGANYSIEKIWDNNYSGSFFIASGASSTPPLFDLTFDLGQEKRLNRFRHWQRGTPSILYGEQQVKRFELWGSDTPDVTANLSGWTLLGTFEIKKPSNAGDYVKIAEAGDNFMIISAPPVRYIRYRVLEIFTNKGAMALGELNFYSPE